MGKFFKKPNVVPKGKLQSKKQKNKKNEDANEYDDEVDVFMNKRNKISLNDTNEDSDEEEVEPVMDLNLPDSDDEDANGVEEDEDEDDDDDGLTLRAKMHLKKQMGLADDVDDDDDGEIEQMYDKKWGKSKKMYYNADVTTDNKQTYRTDFDQQDAENEEEEEAKRLQQKRAAQLKDADFDDDLAVQEEDVPQEEMSFGQRLKQKSKKKDHVSSEQKIVDSLKSDLDSIQFDMLAQDDDTVVESVRKDVTSLSKEEKMELIMNDSPELLQLMDEYNNHIEEIRTKLEPIFESVKNGDLPTSEGVSFLEVKYHLLLSYCTNITFYLLMKASGKSVKDHPVIDELVKIRTILEKMKPLEKKLSYQINKLLTLATTGASEADNDPRSFRPNPELMEDDGEDDEMPQENGKAEKYKAPKLTQTHFDEKSLESKKRKEERERRKAESSQMMKFIRQEYGDEPAEEPNIGASRTETDPEMRKRIEFEEDMYMRLAFTKDDKKKLKKKEKEFDEIQSLADFGDIAAVTKQKEDPNTILTKKSIRDVINRIREDKKADRKRKVHFEAEDTPLEPEFDIEDFNEEDFAPKKKKNKKQKPQSEEEPQYYQESDDEDNEGGKRPINRTMSANRGLTRNRNKETKTPHTRMRSKYNKALSKRRGTVRKMKDKSKPYGGESTGIKANVVHSTKLRF